MFHQVETFRFKDEEEIKSNFSGILQRIESFSSDVSERPTSTGSVVSIAAVFWMSRNAIQKTAVREITGSEAFSFLICLDGTKFVLLGSFTFIQTISRNSGQNHCQIRQKIHFRLACVAQKCLCLSSLTRKASLHLF